MLTANALDLIRFQIPFLHGTAPDILIVGLLCIVGLLLWVMSRNSRNSV